MIYTFWTVNTCMYTITWTVNKKNKELQFHTTGSEVSAVQRENVTLDILYRINTSRTQ